MQFSASIGLTTIQNFSGCGGFGGQVGQGVLCEGNYYDLWQKEELRVRVRMSAGATGINTDKNGIYDIVHNTDTVLQELQNLGGGNNWLDFTTTGEFVVGGFGDLNAPFAEAYLQIAERAGGHLTNIQSATMRMMSTSRLLKPSTPPYQSLICAGR